MRPSILFFRRTVVISALAGMALVLSGTSGFGQTPAMSPGGLVNGASFKVQPSPTLMGVTRGSIVSVFGTNMAGGTFYVDRLPVPTQLTGSDTQVFFDEIAAPLFFVSPNQINAQVPYEIPSSQFTSQISVRRGAISSPQTTIFLNSADPGFFTLLQNGGGPAHVYHQDGSVVSPSNPVRPGEFLTIYATGLGAVTPAVASGAPAPGAPLAQATVLPTVRLAGRSVTVTFAGLTPGFAGLYQINVQVPGDFTTATPSLTMTQGAYSSPSTVSAGGPGLLTANTLSVAAGSGSLPITATGINLSGSSTLRFGARTLATSFQDGQPQGLTGTIPATALRVTGTYPLSATLGGVSSNNLNFIVTGTTVPGSAPVISNLSITAPSTGSLPSSSIGFDFQDADGDIVYNGTSSAPNAKVEFKVNACSSTATNAGSFLSEPDRLSGHISFTLQFIGSGSRRSGPLDIQFTLIDSAGNRSNTITVSMSSWIC